MGWLEGDVALVTGGGSGIGRGVVEVFLEEGARVAVLEKDRKKVEDLKRLGERVVPVVGDVTSLEDNERAVERAVSRFGRLDTLVCCAGVFDGFVSLLEFPKERLGDSFEEIFGVNVKGYILATKAALPQLLRNRGSVIYTTSHAAYAAGGGGVLYTATKFAIRGLVKQMAYELAPKVRVNGVAPGGTRTDLRGLRSMGSEGSSVFEGVKDDDMKKNNPLQVALLPRDHAWAYVYLASKDRSRGVTGVTIQSDGGTGSKGLLKLSGLSQTAKAGAEPRSSLRRPGRPSG
ncbi:MAG: 3-(cis-5,6-dihydroxycyclohexa-1,3-dien-1-yl)propanoate dehydrogenase [Thaumarchaeota archaeon]|nr:MAG: 3-(cis-5,6-dihydroxycyclohexa-1,3-dien-1-yl)propanoate dehydrogenase [Nitrososphaerota archaeon]